MVNKALADAVINERWTGSGSGDPFCLFTEDDLRATRVDWRAVLGPVDVNVAIDREIVAADARRGVA